MMENEIDDLDMGLTFTATQDNFGKIEEIDVKPGGSEIEVNESNKEEYVKLMVNWRFEKGVNEQMDSIIEGVKDIVPIECDRVIKLEFFRLFWFLRFLRFENSCIYYHKIDSNLKKKQNLFSHNLCEKCEFGPFRRIEIFLDHQQNGAIY